MNAQWRRLIHGALAGGIGAATMTVLRMLAHRAGLIEQMVPQAVEAWAQHQLPVHVPAGPNSRSLHHVADQGLHLPVLRIARPEWRAKPVEVAVNLAAHLSYAAAVALLTEEFETQSFSQPLQYPRSLVAQTG